MQKKSQLKTEALNITTFVEECTVLAAQRNDVIETVRSLTFKRMK